MRGFFAVNAIGCMTAAGRNPYFSRQGRRPPGRRIPPWGARLLAPLLCAGLIVALSPCASAEEPDILQSFYVPQAGSIADPLEGLDAVKYFRACPNNDGVSSLPNNARIQVTVAGASGPIAGYPASLIYALFNGGTMAQGYSGQGADSIIANLIWNPNLLCPDVRRITADGPTDPEGHAYITFQGASAIPGVGERDPSRKWGHYDSRIPVIVERSDGIPLRLSGRLAPGDAPDSYVLRIKNFDLSGGLGAMLNQGETTSLIDINSVISGIGKHDDLSYWRDFDGDGCVGSADFNMILFHLNHHCSVPLNP